MAYGSLLFTIKSPRYNGLAGPIKLPDTSIIYLVIPKGKVKQLAH